MITEYTEFLFENKDKENFIDLALNKLIELLPDDDKNEDYAKGILRLLSRENIPLPNNVVINLILHVVCKDGELIPLTPTEVKIAEIMAINRGNIVTYGYLIDKVWKYGDKDLVKVNISNIKKKTGIDIVSVKGIGYTIPKDPTQ